MANLKAVELGMLWVANGGDPSKAGMAAAIAQAESKGDPNAVNKNTNGSIDRGLWQINSVHGAQSTFNKTANVKAAIAISKNGTDWTPWSTYNNGAYKPYFDALPATLKEGIDEGKAAGDYPGVSTVKKAVSGTVDAATSTASALGSIAAFFTTLGNASVWFRIGKVLVGVFLGLFGLVVLIKPKVTV